MHAYFTLPSHLCLREREAHAENGGEQVSPLDPGKLDKDRSKQQMF